MTKEVIPKALREQVWITYNSTKYNATCYVRWCSNVITPFKFEVGHNIPESKGGTLDISNLRPICASCNRSMGNRYTIDEFSALSLPPIRRIMCCYSN
jgi:5-methylcytosine-specific restriction endonuclease McrA